MREILFKAKRIDTGEWVEGYAVRYGFTGKEKWYIVPHYASDLYAIEIDPSTICQYTGLTDKNGQKIWENDVVEISTENGDFIIAWNDTEAKWEMYNKSEMITTNFDEYWSYQVEVIGNIFDN